VHFEASTKPPIHNLIHEVLINMAFIMACPNFKKGLKMAFGPLGVNVEISLISDVRGCPKSTHILFITVKM
jgi:hypothetical protein